MITCSVAFDGVGSLFFFFFNDTATTEIYTLSLHDALPIFGGGDKAEAVAGRLLECPLPDALGALRDALDGLADQDAKEAQRAWESIRELAERLASLLHHEWVVETIRNQRRSPSVALVEIPCAMTMVAEIVMAGVDERRADFLPRLWDGHYPDGR